MAIAASEAGRWVWATELRVESGADREEPSSPS